MTAVDDRPEARGRPVAPPQGGPAADHRPHPVDRQHRAAGHAAPRLRAQPLRARPHHLGSTPPPPRPRPTSSRCSPAPTSTPSRARLPTAWPITPDMKTPRHPALAVDHVAFAGEAVAVVVGAHAARGPGRRRPGRRRLRRAARRARHGGGRSPTGADLVHADLGTNNAAPPGSSTRPRRAPAATSRRPSPQARVGRRRDRAAVPPAAAGAGVHGAALDRRGPDRRADHHVVGHPGAAHPAGHPGARAPASPESKIRVIAPDVGGGFGGKLQFTPEELVTFLVARRLGKPVKFTETRTESIMTGAPRPRPDPAAHAGGDARTAPSPVSRSSCSPTWAPTSAW